MPLVSRISFHYIQATTLGHVAVIAYFFKFKHTASFVNRGMMEEKAKPELNEKEQDDLEQYSSPILTQKISESPDEDILKEVDIFDSENNFLPYPRRTPLFKHHPLKFLLKTQNL